MEPHTSRPQQVAHRIETMIRARAWRVGERIPSVREARRHFGASTATIVDAYGLLEGRGLIEARPRSGFYVRAEVALRPPSMVAERLTPAPSLVRPLQMLAQIAEARERPEMLDLGTALPDPDYLPVARLNRCLTRAIRQSPRRSFELESVQGASSLRREVARQLLTLGVAVAPDELMITVGATQALFLALSTLCVPGDVVAVESPSYYGFYQLLASMGLQALPIPGDAQTGLRVDVLEQALLQGQPIRAVLVMPTVSNPLGAVMPSANALALVSLAARHGVSILEDLTNAELCWDPASRRGLPNPGGMGDIMRCGSLSKATAPGLRLGWCAPGRHYDRMMALAAVQSMAAATVPQLGLAAFLEEGGLDAHLRQMRVSVRAAIEEVRARVLATFPAGTTVTDPAGGHVLWITLPGERVDTSRLFARGVEQGVSMTPGCLFSADQGVSPSFRINAALRWNPRALAALDLLAREAHKLCG